MSKIREKESLECVRMHIWASKTQKLPGPLSGPWTLAAEFLLCSRDSASLRRQLSASEAGAPPWPNPGSAPGFASQIVSFAETNKFLTEISFTANNTKYTHLFAKLFGCYHSDTCHICQNGERKALISDLFEDWSELRFLVIANLANFKQRNTLFLLE